MALCVPTITSVLQSSPTNLTVPCNTEVVWDSNVTIGGSLQIDGMLRVANNGPKTLTTRDLIVHGLFRAGSREAPHTTPATINLQHGELAVKGGALRIFGMAKKCFTKAWIRLRTPAQQGSTQLNLVASQSGCWVPGDEITISATGQRTGEYETRRVARVAGREITITTPLRFSHAASAEVAHITRPITVTGSDWHAIIENDPTPQTVQGVAFINGGRPGQLGKYPLHMHLCGRSEGTSIRGNTFYGSRNRALVIHGTTHVTVADNLAVNTRGHVFFSEDGYETDNRWMRNLAVGASPPASLIPGESDDRPSGFWISNPANTYVENVASSMRFGFWFELRDRVRGASMALPGAPAIRPREAPITEFRGNVAHSTLTGLFTYPDGMLPRGASTIDDFLAYSTRIAGVLHHGGRVNFTGLTIRDPLRRGLHLDRVHDTVVTGARITGSTGAGVVFSPSTPLEPLGRRPPIVADSQILGFNVAVRVADEIGNNPLKRHVEGGFPRTVLGGRVEFPLQAEVAHDWPTWGAVWLGDGSWAVNGSNPVMECPSGVCGGCYRGVALRTAPGVGTVRIEGRGGVGHMRHGVVVRGSRFFVGWLREGVYDVGAGVQIAYFEGEPVCNGEVVV